MKRKAFEEFTANEIIDLFEAFAARHGLERADGRDGEWKDDPRGGITCRFKWPDAAQGKSSAQAHLYLDVPQNGFIEEHRTGERLRWKISEDDAAKMQASGGTYQAQALTADQRAALDAARKKERAERQQAADAETAAARLRMLNEYQIARPVDADNLDIDEYWKSAASGIKYLRNKGVPAARGVRLNRRGSLLIPFYNPVTAAFIATQWITDSDKQFSAGARLGDAGAVFWIESADGQRVARGKDGALYPPDPLDLTIPHVDDLTLAPVMLALCEGYATAASFHRASGLITGSTTSAHNLEKVARAILAAPEWKHAFLILAADDDFLTANEIDPHTGKSKGNAGIEHAIAARNVAPSRVFIARPPWNQKEIIERHNAGDVGKVSDWNDYATEYGNDTAKAAALDALRHARAYFARAMKG